MVPRRYTVLAAAVGMALMLASQGTTAQTSYTLKVSTNMGSYSADQIINVTGTVSPAPGPSTGVFLSILNPSGKELAVGEANVGATTGYYNYTFVAGGSSGWVSGTYTVNATWGAYSPQVYAQTTFKYSPTAVTTTATTTTTTATTTTTSSTTSSTTTTTTQTTTTSSTSSSSSKSSGGIPVFPFEGVLTVLSIAVIISAYFLLRRYAVRGTSLPAR